MKNINQKIAVVGATLTGFLITATPAFARTSSWSGVCVSESDNSVATIQGLQCLLANVLSTFLTLVGIAAFIMIVVAAFNILTSGGNSQNMEKAQKSITFAVIGLVVALSAFIILNLVADFTGVKTILKFNIPGSDTQWPL
ncbi:MAG: hypothetical protein ABII10_01425 [Candidatus Paceibacterota bacterium]